MRVVTPDHQSTRARRFSTSQRRLQPPIRHGPPSPAQQFSTHLHYDDTHIVCNAQRQSGAPGSATIAPGNTPTATAARALHTAAQVQALTGCLQLRPRCKPQLCLHLCPGASPRWLPACCHHSPSSLPAHAPQPLPQPPVSGARQWSHISSQISRGALPAVSRSRTKSTAWAGGWGWSEGRRGT